MEEEIVNIYRYTHNAKVLVCFSTTTIYTDNFLKTFNGIMFWNMS